MTTLGQRLQKARLDAGLTQQQLADKVGRCRVQIAKLEGGKHSPSAMLIMKICYVLNVSPNYLLGWRDKEKGRLRSEILKLEAKLGRVKRELREYKRGFPGRDYP